MDMKWNTKTETQSHYRASIERLGEDMQRSNAVVVFSCFVLPYPSYTTAYSIVYNSTGNLRNIAQDQLPLALHSNAAMLNQSPI